MTQPGLFAQQPYYPGPQQSYPGPQQQPYSYNSQYDPGQQYQQPYAQPQQGNGYGQQQQPLDPDQLQQLVAPIALNPDPLVALMLAASTYPQQVADADHWHQSLGNAPPDQVAYEANSQNWDPSVKALTAFPQVLAEMDQNIQWTAALGNAYYNQPQDVLEAVQIMRQRAQTAGNLQNNPEENVSYDQGNIQVMPANPQVIYVPSYNPWTVYGQPVSPYPGFSLLGALGDFFSSGFGSSAVRFGLGTVLSAFSHTPWGLLAWGLNWLTQNLLFHNSDYYSSSPYVSDWGFRYGGPRAYMAPHRSFASYNRSYGQGYGRNYGQSFNRSQDRYTGNSFRNNYNRGQQTYNRNQQPYSRSNYGSNYNSNYRTGLYDHSESAYASRPNYSVNRSLESNNRYGSSYGSGFASRSQSPFANRSGYTSSYNSNYRAPSSSFDRGSFNQHSSNIRSAYMDQRFNGSSKSSHSSGFHLFGGNHNSNSFGHESNFKTQSFKAPKYKAPKAPKSFGGGGHHSFGGGHHSSGGHSGGHHH